MVGVKDARFENDLLWVAGIPEIKAANYAVAQKK